MAVTTLVMLNVWERVKREVSVPFTTGRMLSLITTLSVVKDSVMVFRGGVARWRGERMVRAGSTTVSEEEPSISRCAGVVAKMFSGAGMEAVSKRGVCLRTLLGVGLMMDGWREEVRLLVGLISTAFVLVRVTVINLVLFWLSSTLKVYGERIVATWDCFERKREKTHL